MVRHRVGIPIVLAVAIGMMPLATDWCAASCDAAHMTGTAANDPICHQDAPSTARLNEAPAPCGHDHGVLPNLVADRPAAASLVQPLAPATSTTLVTFGIDEGLRPVVERTLSPPPDPIPLALSFSLRI